MGFKRLFWLGVYSRLQGAWVLRIVLARCVFSLARSMGFKRLVRGFVAIRMGFKVIPLKTHANRSESSNKSIKTHAFCNTIVNTLVNTLVDTLVNTPVSTLVNTLVNTPVNILVNTPVSTLVNIPANTLVNTLVDTPMHTL